MKEKKIPETEQSIKNAILDWAHKCRSDIRLYPVKNTGTARVDKSGQIYYTRGLMHLGIADLIGTKKIHPFIIAGYDKPAGVAIADSKPFYRTIPIARFLAIECKTPQGLKEFHKNKNRAGTTAFYEWQWGQEIIEQGGIWILATSIDDIQNFLI